MEDPSSYSFLSQLKKTFSSNFIQEHQAEENKEEIEIINNLESFFIKTTREIMIPRPKMITIEKTASVQDAVKLIHDTGYSRIPVQDKKRDNIVGILYSNDLFAYFNQPQDLSISQIIRKPYFISYSLPVYQLLADFRKTRIHMAIIVDEHGGVDGLVTIQDVVEELVGDIPHEFSKSIEPDYEHIEDALVIMDAEYPLDDFNELYETNFQKEGIETIGGYICHSLGKIPSKDENFNIESIKFTVEESNERNLSKLKLTSPVKKKSHQNS